VFVGFCFLFCFGLWGLVGVFCVFFVWVGWFEVFFLLFFFFWFVGVGFCFGCGVFFFVFCWLKEMLVIAAHLSPLRPPCWTRNVATRPNSFPSFFNSHNREIAPFLSPEKRDSSQGPSTSPQASSLHLAEKLFSPLPVSCLDYFPLSS